MKQSKHSKVNILTANGSSVMANDRDENHRGIVMYKSQIGAMPTDKLWLENLVNSTYLGRPWSYIAVITIIDSYLGAGSRLSKWVEWKGRKANLFEAEIQVFRYRLDAVENSRLAILRFFYFFIFFTRFSFRLALLNTIYRTVYQIHIHSIQEKK